MDGDETRIRWALQEYTATISLLFNIYVLSVIVSIICLPYPNINAFFVLTYRIGAACDKRLYQLSPPLSLSKLAFEGP